MPVGGGGRAVKVAVTALFAVIATMHWLPAMTELQPLQTAGLDPDGTWVSVTDCPSSKMSLSLVQPRPQLIAPGAPVTVPSPVPALFTVRVRNTAWNS
ncbi:MAG: hypothetical protein EXQ70_01275 [Solirubrobacterales bacterium]|nr:hypothetical protein [Solirubrobacterales bacterium]